MIRVASLLVFACVASVSVAQRSPMGLTGRIMLLIAPEVKKELKLTKPQTKAIEDLLKNVEKEMQAGGASIDFTNPLGFLEPKLPDILDGAQAVRLDELFVQANGGFSLLDKKTSATLVLTEEQSAFVKKFNSHYTSAMLDKMRKPTKSSMKELEKLKAEFGLKMIAVLTADQANALTVMGGKPFKFKK